MHDTLKRILAHKIDEVAELKQKLHAKYGDLPLAKVRDIRVNTNRKSFQAALSKPGLSIIGEIKRKSPSKGTLAAIKDPTLLVKQYIKGGIDALSILTDKEFFSGSIEDLQAIAQLSQTQSTPILRKDFTIDTAQIVEAVIAGADAILLIVAALGKDTEKLLAVATELDIDAIVEVHNKQELDIALEANAKIIGINNRNLKTFNVDINVGIELVKDVPKNIIKIAESGVRNLDDIKNIKQAGFDAVLIGETLVKSQDPALLIRKMKAV